MKDLFFQRKGFAENGMLNTLRVKFIKHVGDANHLGYRYGEIHSKYFSWVVDISDFGFVHGLSRIVSLIPDKVVTSGLLYEERLPLQGEEGYLVQLVINLLQNFKRDYDLRHQEPIERPPGVRRRCRSVLLDFPDDPNVEDDQGLGLLDTYEILLNSLLDVVSVTTSADRDVYWEAAFVSVQLADKVRELCFVYLELVHPFLVEARRGIDEAFYLRQRRQSLKQRLVRNAGLLLQEFHEARERD